MIQRVQTIFLALAAAGIFGVFAVPFATTPEVYPATFFADADYDAQDHILTIILFALSGLLTAGAIFLFNNRPLQSRITLFGLIANILAIVATVILLMYQSGNVPSEKIDDGFGVYLPVIAIILSFLAIRFINKDEKLVRSADRLR